MADIVNYTPVPLATLLANINTVKYNPSGIQRTILTHLSDVTNGLVDIVDPTNPFIFLLEASSVNTAAAIIESGANTRKQYPSLAQTAEDLYMHMSDKDFIGRFANPSTTTFTFMIQSVSLAKNMVDSPSEKCSKVTIPRNTVFTVNGLSFSIQYPIDIRKYYTGVLQISYDAKVVSPLETLTTNVIDYNVRTDPDMIDWIYFSIPVQQFKINSPHYPVLASSYFSQNIQLTDQYYYCRVYCNRATTGAKWVELYTTHSDQVFDPLKPTALLKVVGNMLNVSIPQIYVNSGLIGGNIRIDVYETQGEMSANMANFLLSSFSTTLLALDDVNDITPYTVAMSQVAFMAYSDKLVVGGTNSIAFPLLRDQVIYNALNPNTVTVTHQQVSNMAIESGFNIVKNVDSITNRIFLALKELPAPTDNTLITPSSLALDTLISDFQTLKGMTGVKDNGSRITITPDTVYTNQNGVISVYPAEQVAIIKNTAPTQQATIVSNGSFVFSPFYYTLDNTTDEFVMRAYHLDAPTTNNLSFISQNTTSGMQVNTASYGISRVSTGYKVTVITKSDATYKALGDVDVATQLAFTPIGETALAYVNGNMVSRTPDGERIWEFMIDTNFDLDASNSLIVDNFNLYEQRVVHLPVSLSGMFDILYTTDAIAAGYIPDVSSNLIGAFLLPLHSIVVTRETLNITFGVALNNLWTSCRSVSNTNAYQTYPADVPLTYDKDVYAVDPVTNAIFSFDALGNIVYTLIHPAGSQAIDAHTETLLFKHRAGDVMLDSSGNPIPIVNNSVLRYMDILFMDGVYYFATDPVYRAYVKEVANTIATWVTSDLAKIGDRLLEQTNVYYYAKRAIGQVRVLDRNGITKTIESRQKFIVTYYVTKNVYDDLAMRAMIENTTISTLNKAIKLKTIAVSDMVTSLRDAFNSDLISINVAGLGGSTVNMNAVTVVNDEDGLSLNKVLVAQEDGTLIVKEDVAVNFYVHQLV